MKHILYSSLLVFLIISCNNGENRQAQSKESKFTKMLLKYQDVSFDTLKVFTTGDLESNDFKYKGRELDSSDVALLPKEFAEVYDYDSGFYSCFKFRIDQDRIGLITRVPSEYMPTSVQLFILDEQKDSITGYLQLAETWGDAGDYYDKTSWLIKDRNKFSSFTWYNEGHSYGVDFEDDTTDVTWNYFYLIDISKSSPDTVSNNHKDLLNKFAGILPKEAHYNPGGTPELLGKYTSYTKDSNCTVLSSSIEFKADSTFLYSCHCKSDSAGVPLSPVYRTGKWHAQDDLILEAIFQDSITWNIKTINTGIKVTGEKNQTIGEFAKQD